MKKELTDDQKRDFLEWSEGNKYLYELLCTCAENDITTFASCGGHDRKDSYPYLGIIINDKSLLFMKNILANVQDMENISIHTMARSNLNSLYEDKELRAITFRAQNYNCCEMFYKMKEGIEDRSQNRMLNPKAAFFYNSILRFAKTSREDIEKILKDNIVEGSTYGTITEEFITFQNSNSMSISSKFLRFFRKFFSSKKENSKSKELQEKYGFLQREYIDSKSPLNQYRAETPIMESSLKTNELSNENPENSIDELGEL